MECEVPEAMVEYQADQMVQDYANRVQSQGFRFEDYLNMMGTTLDQMRQQAKESAGRQVRQNLALEAVADAEGFEITDDEVEAEIARLAGEYDMEADPGTRRGACGGPEARSAGQESGGAYRQHRQGRRGPQEGGQKACQEGGSRRGEETRRQENHEEG